ncbi:unnamed protein product, partial [Prorocentrum cordatum]
MVALRAHWLPGVRNYTGQARWNGKCAVASTERGENLRAEIRGSRAAVVDTVPWPETGEPHAQLPDEDRQRSEAAGQWAIAFPMFKIRASWAERAHAVAQAPAPEVRAAGASLVDRLAGLQLKLKTAAGAEYKVNADGGECIGDVKARLEKTHGIPAGSQRIILLGRELPDAQELLAAGIRDGQSLQLALREGAAAPHGPARPRGSGVAPPPPPGPPPNVRASAENASRAAAVRE